jgi:hypothetical protein
MSLTVARYRSRWPCHGEQVWVAARTVTRSGSGHRLPTSSTYIATFDPAAALREATCIVELYHARERPHSLTQSPEFMLGDRKDEWLAARLEDLDHCYIDGIVAAVCVYPVLRTGQRPVGRHRNHRHNKTGAA